MRKTGWHWHHTCANCFQKQKQLALHGRGTNQKTEERGWSLSNFLIPVWVFRSLFLAFVIGKEVDLELNNGHVPVFGEYQLRSLVVKMSGHLKWEMLSSCMEHRKSKLHVHKLTGQMGPWNQCLDDQNTKFRVWTAVIAQNSLWENTRINAVFYCW